MHVLIKVSIAVMIYHENGKRKYLIGASLWLQRLINYHYGRKHGKMKADMVLVKEQKVLNIDPLIAGRQRATGSDLSY